MVDKKLALVIGVYSADHFLLQLPAVAGKTEHLELRLANIKAPRLGSYQKKDEPLSYIAREWARSKLIAQKVTYSVYGKVKDMEYGSIFLGNVNISAELLKLGYAKLLPKNPEYPSSPYYDDLGKAESIAKEGMLNLFSDKPESLPNAVRDVVYSNDTTFDFDQSLVLLKKKKYDGIIEYVFSGTSAFVYIHEIKMAVRVFFQNVASPSFEKEKKIAEEAKEFTERMILHRNVGINISMIEENKKGFIGEIKHPCGDISNELLLRGLARAIKPSKADEQYFSYLKSMQVAQSKKYGVWKNFTSEITNMVKGGSKVQSGVVLEIHSGDSITVLSAGTEIRIFLSGIKAPSFSFKGKAQSYGWEARECLRKLCIGKAVEFEIEYSREIKKEDKESMIMNFANVIIKPENTCLSNEIAAQGFANVVTPKASEVITKCYEQIVRSESNAKSKKINLFSGVEVPLHNFKDLCGSKNNKEAKIYQEFLKANTRITGTVEYCFSGCKIKLGSNEHNCYISFCCMGLRTLMPDPMQEEAVKASNDAHSFAKKRLLNRDVEAEVLYCDKNGVYYGDLFYNKEHFNVTLLQNGYAYFSCPYNRVYKYKETLKQEEDKAKSHAIGIWASEICKQLALKKQNVSFELTNLTITGEIIEVTDPTRIYIQTIQQKEQVANIDRVINESNMDKLAPVDLSTIKLRSQVVCQFSADNKWYRAVVLVKPLKDAKEVLVRFVDFGSTEYVGISKIKPTNEILMKFPPMCTQIGLAYLLIPGNDHILYNPLVSTLQKMLIEKKVTAKVLYRCSEVSYSIIMKEGKMNAESSFNAFLLESGYCRIDKKIILKEEYNVLLESEKKAKSAEKGAWEIGKELYSDTEEQ